MLITISGKGGTGKTTITALLIDELLHQDRAGRLLAVDADPAQTLHFALGVEPPRTSLAQVRETTSLSAAAIRDLPPDVTPAQHVKEKLVQTGVIATRSLREHRFDLMAMGHGEGAGCYCAINSALGQALASIIDNYDLILIDSEAGLEHLSRYRLQQVDLFLVVTTGGRASLAVSGHIMDVARQVGMEIEETGIILNRLPAGVEADEALAAVPDSPVLSHFDISGKAAVELAGGSAPRRALNPIIERIEALSDVRLLVP